MYNIHNIIYIYIYIYTYIYIHTYIYIYVLTLRRWVFEVPNGFVVARAPNLKSPL